MSQDFLQVVNSTVAGSLGTGLGAAVGLTLTGQNAVLPHALQAAVLAVHVADFAAANAHITSGNVHIGSDVTVQSGHVALAEAHDLSIRLAGGIEVSAALTTAHGQAGQGVLKGLLEAQELDDGGGNIGLEAQAALIGTNGAVELAAVADIGMPLAVVVTPDNTEGEHTLRLDHTGQQVSLLIFGMSIDDGRNRSKNLFNSLAELGLISMLGLYVLDYAFNISVHWYQSPL